MGVKFGREKQILTCYLFQTHQSHITAFSYTRLSNTTNVLFNETQVSANIPYKDCGQFYLQRQRPPAAWRRDLCNACKSPAFLPAITSFRLALLIKSVLKCQITLTTRACPPPPPFQLRLSHVPGRGRALS